MSEPGPEEKIDATFRNGSLTAAGIILGFSLTFISRWVSNPNDWSRIDILPMLLLTTGIALQVKVFADLLARDCEFMANRDLRAVESYPVRRDLREEFLAKDFGRCFVAEALARCCVQVIADIGQIAIGDRQWIDLSRKPFPGAAVGVFDGAFLPRRLRIAEPCLGSDACLQVGPVGEFGTTVEGDRAAGEVGQGLEAPGSARPSPASIGGHCCAGRRQSD